MPLIAKMRNRSVGWPGVIHQTTHHTMTGAQWVDQVWSIRLPTTTWLELSGWTRCDPSDYPPQHDWSSVGGPGVIHQTTHHNMTGAQWVDQVWSIRLPTTTWLELSGWTRCDPSDYNQTTPQHDWSSVGGPGVIHQTTHHNMTGAQWVDQVWSPQQTGAQWVDQVWSIRLPTTTWLELSGWTRCDPSDYPPHHNQVWSIRPPTTRLELSGSTRWSIRLPTTTWLEITTTWLELSGWTRCDPSDYPPQHDWSSVGGPGVIHQTTHHTTTRCDQSDHPPHHDELNGSTRPPTTPWP